MLDVIRERPTGRPVRLLDFGCGASALYEYMLDHDIKGIDYSGLDISERFVALSSSKFPDRDYYCLDILADDASLPKFDYVVLNGVLTEKLDLSFEEMFSFARDVLNRAFALARMGIAFNVMSKHVDWERDDLFHLPFDLLARHLTTDLTRDFVIRSDPGLYEYITYAYR